jgi:hypothetical protein
MTKVQEVAGFEVLIPVVMKSSVFWDTTPCSPLTVKKQDVTCIMLVSCLAYSSTLKMEAI